MCKISKKKKNNKYVQIQIPQDEEETQSNTEMLWSDNNSQLLDQTQTNKHSFSTDFAVDDFLQNQAGPKHATLHFSCKYKLNRFQY